MKWFTKLERKMGKFAIPHLMYYIIIMYVVGFIFQFAAPSFYFESLSLDASKILQGQVWRIFTFLIQPPSEGIIGNVIMIYLYYWIGSSLEASWGAFRFNLYFFMGVIFHVLAAIIAYLITGISFQLGTGYLNLSLFFAFAVMYPNVEVLLFFIIPVKMKYLAWIDAAFFGYAVLQSVIPAYAQSAAGVFYKANAIAAIISILNFLLFYFLTKDVKTLFKQKNFQARRKREIKKNSIQKADGSTHCCATCGRTELDNPSLEFRFCSKCRGNYEYCQEHLFTHEHK